MNEKLRARMIVLQTPFEERKRIYRAAFKQRRLQPRSRKYHFQGDWIKYVFSIHRTCQVQAFSEISRHLSDRVYWRLLGHIFWRAENHGVYHDLYLHLLQSSRTECDCFMTPAQQRGWDDLPDRVMIFRGHGAENRCGLFYSLKFLIAADVASGYGSAGKVSSYIVSKNDLFYVGSDSKSNKVAYEAVLYVKGLRHG
jgi:hypothetical protein